MRSICVRSGTKWGLALAKEDPSVEDPTDAKSILAAAIAHREKRQFREAKTLLEIVEGAGSDIGVE